MTVAGRKDVLHWVQGYGSGVEVLEPAWLREEVLADARRVVARYEVGAEQRRGE